MELSYPEEISMKKHLSLSLVTGLFAIVCYLAFALLAFAHYPLPYSPLRNWLSFEHGSLSDDGYQISRFNPRFPRPAQAYPQSV
jgi:hypothetical protein